MATQPSRTGLMTAAAATLAAAAGLIGSALAWTPPHTEAVRQGAGIYAEACGGCHAANLGGTTRGSPAAPPLDATGHAWQHADAELAAIIAFGTPGGMPGFAGRLSPAQIRAVLAFLQAQWPADQRLWQASLNPVGRPALAALLRDPDWRLPGDCPPDTDAAR